MLSQNFTLAVSTQNLGVTFDNNHILDSIFPKLVLAAFITFMTFVVFAGIYLLLSPKLLQLLFVAVDLTIAIPFIIILLSRHLKTSKCAKLFGKGSYRFLVSLIQYFLNHCTGSLSNIALFLRSVQFPNKHFHPSNQHIYIHCSLLQDRPDSFNHLILIYFCSHC